jgi:hypothetical protein
MDMTLCEIAHRKEIKGKIENLKPTLYPLPTCLPQAGRGALHSRLLQVWTLKIKPSGFVFTKPPPFI